MQDATDSIMDEMPLVDFEDLAIHLDSKISSLASSDLIIVLGCENGSVWVYESGSLKPIAVRMEKFKSRVVAVSIDDACNTFVAVSSSGEVRIVENVLLPGVSVNEVDVIEDAYCPINAVAICPGYSESRENRRVVVAGSSGDLIVLSQQGTPFPPKSLSKTGSRGPVTSVVWQTHHLVWAGPQFGIKAINTSTSQRIVSIPSALPRGVKVASVGRGLFASWSGYTVTVFRMVGGDVCEIKRQVELPSDQFAPDSEIGLLMGPNRHRLVSVGLFDPASNEYSLTLITSNASQVCMHFVDTIKRDIPLSEFVCDAAGTANGDVLVSSFFSSSSSSSSNSSMPYILVWSGSKLMRVVPRSIFDNCCWLIDRGFFQQAIDLSAVDSSIAEIVVSKALHPLVASGQVGRVGALLERLNLDTEEKWSKIIDSFISLPSGPELRDSLHLLVPLLPVPPRDPLVLRSADYDRVLASLMRNLALSSLDLLETLRRWPVRVYSVDTVQDQLIDAVPEDFELTRAEKKVFIPKSVALFPPPDDTADSEKFSVIALMISLHIVFTHTSRIPDSLDILMRLHCVSEVFAVLRDCAESHVSVRSWFMVNLLSLFQLEAAGTANFLIANELLFPRENIASELRDHPFFLHVFYRELFLKDPEQTREVQQEQVSLFVQFDKDDLLLVFLRGAAHYDAQTALLLVQNATPRLVEAEALLLYKCGNFKDAVSLLLDDSSGDLTLAVRFAAETGNPDLWNWLWSRVKMNKLDCQFLTCLYELSQESYSLPRNLLPETVLLETPLCTAEIALKIIEAQKLSQCIETCCAKLLRHDYDGERGQELTSTLPHAIIDPALDLCRVCGQRVACRPAGFSTHLAVICGKDRAHHKCLVRTVADFPFLS